MGCGEVAVKHGRICKKSFENQRIEVVLELLLGDVEVYLRAGKERQM